MTASSLLAAVLAGKARCRDHAAPREAGLNEQSVDAEAQGARMIARDILVGPQVQGDFQARRGETLEVTSPQRDTLLNRTASGWKCVRHQVAGKLEEHAWDVHEKLVQTVYCLSLTQRTQPEPSLCHTLMEKSSFTIFAHTTSGTNIWPKLVVGVGKD